MHRYWFMQHTIKEQCFYEPGYMFNKGKRGPTLNTLIKGLIEFGRKNNQLGRSTNTATADTDTAEIATRPVYRKEKFYLTTHSTHFIYGYMASDIWLRTILIVRKETRCRHIGYSFWLAARVLLYAPSHRQDSTYTSRGALAGTRNSSMGSHHGGSIRWPIAPWANTLTTELHLAPTSI